MRRLGPLLPAFAVLVACSPAPAAPAADQRPPAPLPPATAALQPTVTSTSDVITPEGLGALRIGMSQTEALATLGSGWVLDDPIDDPNGCRTIGQGTADDRGAVYVMLDAGRVVRVSVSGMGDNRRSTTVRSDRGVGLGATEDEVRRAYGDQLQAEGHRYLGPTAQYLTVWTRGAPASADVLTEDPAARGIRFVTGDDRRVQEIHAGGPAIQYVEGCA